MAIEIVENTDHQKKQRLTEEVARNWSNPLPIISFPTLIEGQCNPSEKNSTVIQNDKLIISHSHSQITPLASNIGQSHSAPPQKGIKAIEQSN